MQLLTNTFIHYPKLNKGMKFLVNIWLNIFNTCFVFQSYVPNFDDVQSIKETEGMEYTILCILKVT